jgi:hypothetical protein
LGLSTAYDLQAGHEYLFPVFRGNPISNLAGRRRKQNPFQLAELVEKGLA